MCNSCIKTFRGFVTMVWNIMLVKAVFFIESAPMTWAGRRGGLMLQLQVPDDCYCRSLQVWVHRQIHAKL